MIVYHHQSVIAHVTQDLDFELDVLYPNKPVMLMTDEVRRPTMAYHNLSQKLEIQTFQWMWPKLLLSMKLIAKASSRQVHATRDESTPV